MSFGTTEPHQVYTNSSKVNRSTEEKETVQHSAKEITSGSDDCDDCSFSTSSIIELDRKDLLIVKDGTVRVAESLDRERQQLNADGEVVKALGTWTKAEHERFLHAMATFPRGPWKAIAEMVATRTVRQTQTHAQKYREKLARRMRGLRNRNGTLQTPPMTGTMCYPQHLISPYASVHTRGYQPMTHPGTLGYSSSAIPLARTTSLPSMPLHSPPPHHSHTSYASNTMPVSVAMISSDFSQLSTSAISSAFIENATYPSSWEVDETDNKLTVPDYEESMDFLMDVYSTNPSQIDTAVPSPLTGMAATPTASFPRTPPTPMSSMAMKRHSWYDVAQRPQRRYDEHFTYANNNVNSEQEAKCV